MSQFIEMFKNSPINGTIADLVDNNIKSVKKTFAEDELIEYIDISSIDCMNHSIGETIQYCVQDAPSRAQQCVNQGDILVLMVRPINRNVAVVTKNRENMVASTGFCVLRPEEGFREYLLSIVESDAYTFKMCDKASGGLYPAVNNGDVLTYKIFIPNETILSRVSAIYNQADKSKFGGFKSQLIEMFGNPILNSKGWATEKMKDVAPEAPTPKEINGKVWLLNLDMIESNTGNVISKVYEEAEESLSVQPFDEDNVLFSKLRPYLNKVVIPDEPSLATTELVPLRPNSVKLHKVFLSNLLRSKQFVNFANDIAGGTKMPRMPLFELRGFDCILPPMELQREFVRISQQADKSKSYSLWAQIIVNIIIGDLVNQVA